MNDACEGSDMGRQLPRKRTLDQRWLKMIENNTYKKLKKNPDSCEIEGFVENYLCRLKRYKEMGRNDPLHTRDRIVLEEKTVGK